MKNQVKVGVGVYIFNAKKQILLGKRIASHGAHTWCAPGGHLEFGESPEQCAYRETQEECNIQITNLRSLPYSNDFFEKDKKHYITLQFYADYLSGNLQVKEPDKFECWEWFDWNNLPNNLFLTLSKTVKTPLLNDLLKAS